MEQATRPLFVGNLAPYVKARHLTRLFEEKGTVEKIDLKTGFAFIFMPNLEEAEAALDKFNNHEMEENNRRPLKVEWAKGDGSVKKREDDRKTNAQNNPCETLFVVNFDTARTRERDLEKMFDPFGKSKRPRVEVRRNYAFVQFNTVEEATEARIAMNGKLVDDRELTVEYVARQRQHRSRSRSRSPRRRRSRSRSRSPRRSGGGGGGGGGGGRDRSRSRSRDRGDRDRDRDRRR